MAAATAKKIDTIKAGQDVLANATCMGIRFTGMTFSRRIDLRAIVQGERGKDITHSLDLIDTRASVVKAIEQRAEKFRTWIKGRALPSDLLPHGVYMVPLGLVEPVVQRVEVEHAERTTLVEAMLAQYDQLKDEAKKRAEHTVKTMTEKYQLDAAQAADLLETLCDEGQYPLPSEIRQRFGVSLRYYDCGVPQQLAKVNSALHEAAIAQFNQDVAAMYDEVKEALRVSFGQLIGHLVERLTPVPDGGKAKALRSNMLEGLTDFFNTFEARNLVNDYELQQLVQKARQVMHGVSVDDLKQQPALRDQIKTQMDKLAGMVDQSLKVKAKRRIVFSDDDDK
jgi:hypothetical protein